MQRLEVSGARRPIYGSLGVKRLTMEQGCWFQQRQLHVEALLKSSPAWSQSCGERKRERERGERDHWITVELSYKFLQGTEYL